MAIRVIAVALGLMMAACVPPARAQGPGGPPASVAVALVREGTVSPEAEFVGTIFFSEVSEVSAEVSGRVEEVRFEEGRKIAANEVLVRLDAELLEKTLKATRASHEQAVADLEKAERDLQRVANLHRQELIAEQLYDENRFKVKSQEKKAESLQAEVERLEAELTRKNVRAPFSGLILQKKVNRGEWVSPGAAVATLARVDVVDAVVEVPGEIVPFLRPGLAVTVKAAGRELRGVVTAVIARGDVSTRTFPVKVRVPNSHSLIEGMEARVNVPTGKRVKGLLVPRDALVPSPGGTIVFAVADAKAKSIPVKVLAYAGKDAAVEAQGLRKGMQVVVKGNERIREGQPVIAVRGGSKPPAP